MQLQFQIFPIFCLCSYSFFFAGINSAKGFCGRVYIVLIWKFTRHRAAIETKNQILKLRNEKLNKIKKQRTNLEPWTLKVALRPSGVLLVMWHGSAISRE